MRETLIQTYRIRLCIQYFFFSCKIFHSNIVPFSYFVPLLFCSFFTSLCTMYKGNIGFVSSVFQKTEVTSKLKFFFFVLEHLWQQKTFFFFRSIAFFSDNFCEFQFFQNFPGLYKMCVPWGWSLEKMLSYVFSFPNISTNLQTFPNISKLFPHFHSLLVQFPLRFPFSFENIGVEWNSIIGI